MKLAKDTNLWTRFNFSLYLHSRYQKTVSSLNEGGKKVSGGFSSAGTKIKLVFSFVCFNVCAAAAEKMKP